MAAKTIINGINITGAVVPLRTDAEPTVGVLYQHVSDDPTNEAFLDTIRTGAEAHEAEMRKAQRGRGVLGNILGSN